MSKYSRKVNVPGQRVKLTADEFDKVHSRAVRFIIKSSQESRDLIKKRDIVKRCFQEHGQSYDSVMEAVRVYLNKILDRKLVEVETGTKPNIVKQYFLVSNSEVPKRYTKSSTQKDYAIVLGFTLTHIQGMGGKCHEDTLWQLLEGMKILSKTGNHPFFGVVKKRVLVEFPKHLYIETSPSDHGVLLKWGKRAFEEFTKEMIDTFLSKLFSRKFEPNRDGEFTTEG